MIRYVVAIIALAASFTAFSSAGFGDESTPPTFDPFHVPGVYWQGLAPYLNSGNGTIEGRFAAKTKMFGETAFPNTRVNLVPAQMITWWIIKSTGYNLEHDDYAKHDPMPHFPSQLNPYERWTMTDANGYFRFTNLPDGKYYVFGTPERINYRHPTRYTTQEQVATNGDTVTMIEKSEGLKELSDIVTIAASVTVDNHAVPPSWTVTSFDVFGESTCCKAEL